MIIINDYHAFSPIALGTPQELIAEITKHKVNGDFVLYLGDNIDMRNCEMNEVLRAKDFLDLCKKLCDAFVLGNHELNQIEGANFYVKDGILFTHGDFIAWNIDRVKSFRAQQAGASWVKRNIIVPVIDWARHTFEPMVNDLFKKQALAYAAEYGVKKIVIGHRHPKERMDFMVEDVNVIILPRGVNIL